MCRSLKLFSCRCWLKCDLMKFFRLHDEKRKLGIRFFFFSCHHSIVWVVSTPFSIFTSFFWVKVFLAPLGSGSCGVVVHRDFKTWPLHCVVLMGWAQIFRLMQPAIFLLAAFWKQHCSALKRVIICSYVKQSNLAKLLILLMIRLICLWHASFWNKSCIVKRQKKKMSTFL